MILLGSAMAGMLASPAGCERYRSASREVEAGFRTTALDRQYRQAQAAFAEEHWALAATSAEGLIDRLPESPRREELLFHQGEAYLQLKDYHRAEQTLRQYQEDYAAGRYRAEAEQHLARIAVARSEAELAGEEVIGRARDELNELKSLEERYPADWRIKNLLGDMYYELGNYELAARYYYGAQSLNAAATEMKLARERLFINERGEPEVLTPAAIRRLERDRHPIVVFDEFTYLPRGRNFGDSGSRSAVIHTGKVRNQGTKTLENVVLEVRFLNAVNEMLDFQIISLRTLRPGDVRPFLARADYFTNLFNVTEVEVLVRVEP